MEKTLGYAPAIATTVYSFGIGLNQWADYQSAVSIENTISKDTWLPAPFSKLSREMSLIVYTNMASKLATEVLRYLDISSYVSTLLTPQILGHAKPSTEAISRIIADGLIEPQTTLAVGDRYYLDIEPITALGGYGYIVDSPGSLKQLFGVLLSREVNL
jgi:FMN phosphatase YigB (HAD superfamily)